MAAAQTRTVLFFDHPLAPDAAGRFAVAVGKLGMAWTAVVRPATNVTPDEAAQARFRVAFTPIGGVTDIVEVWPADAGRLDAEVNDLVARLFTGAARGTTPKPVPIPPPAKEPKPPKPHTVKVGRETKGRRGKGVTLVSELPTNLGEAGVAGLAAALKNRCGTGGTVKDGVIEIQGDQRDRVTQELERLGYRVKRSGGVTAGNDE